MWHLKYLQHAEDASLFWNQTTSKSTVLYQQPEKLFESIFMSVHPSEYWHQMSTTTGQILKTGLEIKTSQRKIIIYLSLLF